MGQHWPHWNLLCSIIIVSIFTIKHCNAKLIIAGLDDQKGSSNSSCNIFEGSWIYDDSYPFYDTYSNCPFVEKEFDCQKNGRPDKAYLKYKWKPTSCELPRFNGTDLLMKLKGKKILLVGDSLSLNQWQSLTCIIHSSVPHSNYTLTRKSGLSTFHVPDYDLSVMLFRSSFLVDLVKNKNGTILKLDSIKNGHAWKGYDFLIFNTWHWWLHKGSKKPWNYIELRGTMYEDMDRLVAFKEGLTTWSKWVDSEVDHNKTTVLFQGISPTHYRGDEWDDSNSTTCKGQTEPVNGSTYPGGGPLPAQLVVEDVLTRMSSDVRLLDITKLSQLRKDGHPSIYGFGGTDGNDCSHWCLAGVPDTWNHLFYASLN